MVDADLLQQVRQAARQRRREAQRQPADAARVALAGIVDVGSLTDDDVVTLYGAYQAALSAPDVVRPSASV